MAEKEEMLSINGRKTLVFRSIVPCQLDCHWHSLVLRRRLLDLFQQIQLDGFWEKLRICSPSQARKRRLAGKQHSRDTECWLRSDVWQVTYLLPTLQPFASSSLLSAYTHRQSILSLAAHWVPLPFPSLSQASCIIPVFSFTIDSLSSFELCIVITMCHLFPHKLIRKGTFISLVPNQLLKQALFLGYRLVLFRTFSNTPAG